MTSGEVRTQLKINEFQTWLKIEENGRNRGRKATKVAKGSKNTKNESKQCKILENSKNGSEIDAGTAERISYHTKQHEHQYESKRAVNDFKTRKTNKTEEKESFQSFLRVYEL